MKKNDLILLFIVLFTSLLGACKGKQSSEKVTSKKDQRPNFLILFVDDLGYNDIGFRNQKFFTPAIDKLASESLLFNYAYVPSPTCSPSRAALYTGKHAARLGIYRHIPHNPEGEFHTYPDDPAGMLSRNWLTLEEITYAEVLSKHGYNTFMAGKWHLGEKEYYPEKQGFQKYIVGGDGSGLTKKYLLLEEDGEKTEKYTTDFLTDSVVDYLESYNDQKPFLIQFSYWNVHTPTVGRKDLVQYYQSKGLTGVEAEYAAQVSSVDESIGRVLKALDDNGLAENTVVIFASDQGSLFPNTPLRGGKPVGTALYEGGARIPFFIKWPNVTKAGAVCNEHVSTLDIFPTLLDICGSSNEDSSSLDGLSLVDIIKNNTSLKRDYLFFYRAYDAQYASVLGKDGFKLIAYRGNKYELYNIYEDIGEKNEISELFPDRKEELINVLYEWEKSLGIDVKSHK